jgi:hypothetical protein
MEKAELKILEKLSGANIAFFLCEKLQVFGVHMCEGKIVNKLGDEYENSEDALIYFIQKLCYMSSYYEPSFEIAEIVSEHRYIFQCELTSKEKLITMLLE